MGSKDDELDVSPEGSDSNVGDVGLLDLEYHHWLIRM